ncbi:monovalent cation/H+ antiporter complex subunit F [Kocuria sp. CPCC 205292]|uniref:monovalent cation/H+ antiporter complex subunit F n=1 Tax=Kocuria cellulosilytica TaxID=3071451 RepID=UPI00262A79DB|nr:monovalent cation/H+ antiporter complex subunit F [uncultured Kocuria sp.]
MIGILFGVLVLTASVVVAGVRMFVGPNDANRVIASDLLFFSVIGLIALLGVLVGSRAVFDLVLVATLVGLLATVSLARALTNGRR